MRRSGYNRYNKKSISKGVREHPFLHITGLSCKLACILGPAICKKEVPGPFEY